MKKVYFVGIKGVGMTPLALMAKAAGCTVTGSDIKAVFTTDTQLKKAEIPVNTEFDPTNVEKFFQEPSGENLLIYTAAHNGAKNTEVQKAIQKGIPTLSLGRAIGYLMDGKLWEEKKIGISIAGTHGKTTTAALIAHLLTEAKEDPSFLVGSSDILPIGSPGHAGQGKYLVVEADEYVSDNKTDPSPKFLYQHPEAAIVTNIDFDHPDVFKNIDEVKNAFGKFMQNIKKYMVINIDDKNSLEVAVESGKKYTTFGVAQEADFRFTNIRIKEGLTHFEIKKGDRVYSCTISLSGDHNVANATAAIALLDTLGISPDLVVPHLATFIGTKRRSEEKGATRLGALVIDDYAHHPREIQATLKGLSQKYRRKIICIFQPHTYSRTEALLAEFADSFRDADNLILLPIFSSAREGKDDRFPEEKYTHAFKTHPEMHSFADKEAVIKYLEDKEFDDRYLIVTMGAGDVYKVGEALVGHERGIV